MKYYSFASHVYYTICKGKLILLDSKRDQYIFLDEKKTALLLRGMQGQMNTGVSARENLAVEEAIRKKFIIPSPHCLTFTDHLKPPRGIGNHEWSIPISDQKHTASFSRKIKILFTFWTVKGAILCGRLDWLFRKIQIRNNTKCHPPHNLQDAVDLARDVRETSLLLPFRSACLENAIVTALLLRSDTNVVQFSIGIQVNPFLAHAWVSHQGHVLLDKPSLNEDMTKIVAI